MTMSLSFAVKACKPRSGIKSRQKMAAALRRALSASGMLGTRLFAGSLRLDVVATPFASPQSPDLDNVLKALGDALTDVGLIRDDRDFDEIHIVRRKAADGPRLDITLTQLAPPSPAFRGPPTRVPFIVRPLALDMVDGRFAGIPLTTKTP